MSQVPDWRASGIASTHQDVKWLSMTADVHLHADAPQPSASALSRARQAISSATPTRLVAAFRTLLLVIPLLFAPLEHRTTFLHACQG